MVIETKSVEFMPLYLSIASFCNGACWTIYSLLKFDINILVSIPSLSQFSFAAVSAGRLNFWVRLVTCVLRSLDTFFCVHTPYVFQVPNGIGLVFSTIQLILYFVYYKSTVEILANRKRGEIGLNDIVVRGEANKDGNGGV